MKIIELLFLLYSWNCEGTDLYNKQFSLDRKFLRREINWYTQKIKRLSKSSTLTKADLEQINKFLTINLKNYPSKPFKLYLRYYSRGHNLMYLSRKLSYQLSSDSVDKENMLCKRRLPQIFKASRKLLNITKRTFHEHIKKPDNSTASSPYHTEHKGRTWDGDGYARDVRNQYLKRIKAKVAYSRGFSQG